MNRRVAPESAAALVRKESWGMDQLRLLDRKHSADKLH
jgi:hypothetical protein